MSTVLLTGAFGNVGQSTLKALLAAGHSVIAFDCPSRANKQRAKRLIREARAELGGTRSESTIRLEWADIRDAAKVSDAASACDAIIHLAAIIPPLADRLPNLAAEVNIGGTKTVIKACERYKLPLIYASSVALYGDRLHTPQIQVGDPVQPATDDNYGFQKAEAEGLVRVAACPWTVLRLSYVVWRKKLRLDPLMFRMPLGTCIEVVHTEDAGRALAHAVDKPGIRGKIYNIGGGASCRTTYRDYLCSMFALFGLGRSLGLPEQAFAEYGYHCGWLDSDSAELDLNFQKRSLADYYVEVAQEARISALFARPFKAMICRILAKQSPYLSMRT